MVGIVLLASASGKNLHFFGERGNFWAFLFFSLSADGVRACGGPGFKFEGSFAFRLERSCIVCISRINWLRNSDLWNLSSSPQIVALKYFFYKKTISSLAFNFFCRDLVS